MNYRSFGKTSLKVSEVGFGAWAIGGPAMAGNIPIGWGNVDDNVSLKALEKAYFQGINFYDTADFYGFGHSESLLGRAFKNQPEVIIATKVGQKLGKDGLIYGDYTKDYILRSCENSLRRLGRETIDFYQLHTAKVKDLESGEYLEAMQQLQQEGKIRYWGISLNTFEPDPEAVYFLERGIGQGFQLVFNILNQEALNVIQQSRKAGYGVIARMPLQFGLLTGKFTKESRFSADDHRAFRLPPDILSDALDILEEVWPLREKYGMSKTAFALSFILGFEGVSTLITGIRTPEQAISNTTGIVAITTEDRDLLMSLYASKFRPLLMRMK